MYITYAATRTLKHQRMYFFSMSKRKNLKWNCSWIQNLFLRFDGKRSNGSSVVSVLVARRNIFLITLLRISITCASKPKTAECILKLWGEEVGMKYEVHMHTHTPFSICLIHSLQSWKNKKITDLTVTASFLGCTTTKPKSLSKENEAL